MKRSAFVADTTIGLSPVKPKLEVFTLCLYR